MQTGTSFDLVENQHVPVEQAIQKAYGVTAIQFEQAVKEYFHSLTPLFVALDASKRSGAQPGAPPVYQFPEIVGPDSSVITAKVLREADARALAAEVKTRIPDRRAAGLQELQALATAAESTAPRKTELKDERKNALLVTAVGDEIAHRALAW